MVKGNPIDFVAKLIWKLLREENFGKKQVKIGRAHRINHEPVKEHILRLSRVLKSFPYNTKVHLHRPPGSSGKEAAAMIC